MALVVAGGVAERAIALPAPEELVPNTAALVSDVPVRLGTITKAEFWHALALAAAFAGRSSAPKPGEGGYGRLEERAVNDLLEAVWIRGEAAEMGIVVTPRQVSRQLALIKRQSFESEAEYRQFLRKNRYTARDVNERVELQILSLRLQERLVRRIARETRGKAEEQKALQEFVAEFNARWRGRTVCAPEYATERCSNGPTIR